MILFPDRTIIAIAALAKKRKMLKEKAIIILLLAGAAVFFVVNYFTLNKKPETDRPAEQSSLPLAIPTANDKTGQIETPSPSIESENESETKLPDKALIKVPFLVQAPSANWDALHEEACEEASLIMVRHFLEGTDVTFEAGEKEILDLVDFQEKNGYGASITLKALAEIAEKYYGLSRARTEENVSIEKIKSELADNRPVIIPAAGKILPNPNFRNGGPNYHMLVVIGYDKDEFITNDPGTRKGQYFRYKHNDLYQAIHDWNPANIYDGQKSYLVFD